MTMTKFKISFKRRDIHMSEEVLSEPKKDENVFIKKIKPFLDRMTMIISIVAGIWCIVLSRDAFYNPSVEDFDILFSLSLVCLSLFVLAVIFVISFLKVSDKAKIVTDLIRLAFTWLAFFATFFVGYDDVYYHNNYYYYNDPSFFFPYVFLVIADTVLYLSSKYSPAPSNDEKMTQLSSSLGTFFGGISLVAYFFISAFSQIAAYTQRVNGTNTKYDEAGVATLSVSLVFFFLLICLLLIIIFSKKIRSNNNLVYALVALFSVLFIIGTVVQCIALYNTGFHNGFYFFILALRFVSQRQLSNWTALLLIFFSCKPVFKIKSEDTNERKELAPNVVWAGTPGEAFSFFLGQGLLVLITLGIYSPWAFCNYKNWVYNRSSYDGHRYKFNGKGGELLIDCLFWGLLSIITLGIYSFWAVNNLKAWENANIIEVKEGANPYSQQLGTWNGTASDVFVFGLVNGFLIAITLGIYTPWFYCKYKNWVYEHSSYQGLKYRFTGDGGDLFGKCLVWGILSVLTLGIYSFWAFNYFKEWENRKILVAAN
jgi:uncharacterized membrane protein YjgN (DUF898 family)